MQAPYTAGHATCTQAIRHPSCSAYRNQIHHTAWSSHSLPPALVAAAKLLQQHPRLAAAHAGNNRSSSCSSTCDQHQQPQYQHQQQLGQLTWPCQHGCGHTAAALQQPQQFWQPRQQQYSLWRIPCLPDSTDTAGTADAQVAARAEQNDNTEAAGSAQAAAQTAAGRAAAAAAALARLQHLSHPAATAGPGTAGSSSGRGSAGQLQKPVRPAHDHTSAQQQQQQQALASSDRLLTWRSRRRTAAAAAHQTQQQQQQVLLQVQQSPPPYQQQQQQQQEGTVPPQQQLQQQKQLKPQQQQQQLQALQAAPPPLEPSFVGGRAYLTSPVSFVAATTPTKGLAGSISIAFEVHQHQLMFAVGPQPLAIALKALATARAMLAAGNGSQPVNILMQPTLRGKAAPRSQAYALDIMQVGELPMEPGIEGRQQAKGGQQGAARAKVVHITSSSNEVAAARSLVENMPARGQTIMRVSGPFAAETAVLAVALARPLMRQRWGQDLAVLVMWGEHRAYRGTQTGLLLAVFRCEGDSYPPKVLLLPPSKRNAKKAQYWKQRQQHQQQLGKQKEQPGMQPQQQGLTRQQQRHRLGGVVVE